MKLKTSPSGAPAPRNRELNSDCAESHMSRPPRIPAIFAGESRKIRREADSDGSSRSLMNSVADWLEELCTVVVSLLIILILDAFAGHWCPRRAGGCGSRYQSAQHDEILRSLITHSARDQNNRH